MHIAAGTVIQADIHRLISACLKNQQEPALGQFLTPQHWDTLSGYLHGTSLAPGQVLISQGGTDRTVYFLERGSLSVHDEDAAGRVRLATIGPGSAVGEGSFFSHLPRNATVQAAGACRVWALPATAFSELSNRQPATALALALALGALVSVRMVDRRKRIAVT